MGCHAVLASTREDGRAENGAAVRITFVLFFFFISLFQVSID